jgi:hypothetical protein
LAKGADGGFTALKMDGAVDVGGAFSRLERQRR